MSVTDSSVPDAPAEDAPAAQPPTIAAQLLTCDCDYEPLILAVDADQYDNHELTCGQCEAELLPAEEIIYCGCPEPMRVLISCNQYGSRPVFCGTCNDELLVPEDFEHRPAWPPSAP